MFIKTTLTVLLVCGGLIAAGCGGDDDETTSTTSTAETGASGASGASGETGEAAGGGLLPDDFATEVNGICEAGNDEINAAAGELFGQGQQEPSQAKQVKFETEVLIPSIEGQITAIRALGEPEEGGAELSAVLEDADAVVEDVKKDPGLLLSGDADPFAEIGKQFKDLGTPACAN